MNILRISDKRSQKFIDLVCLCSVVSIMADHEGKKQFQGVGHAHFHLKGPQLLRSLKKLFTLYSNADPKGTDTGKISAIGSNVFMTWTVCGRK